MHHPTAGPLPLINVAMDPTVKYLLSLGAIRDRAKIVGQAAKDGNLNHFDVHEDKLDDVADFVTSVIKVCYTRPPKLPQDSLHRLA